MKFENISELVDEYNSCNEFNRRNELFCKIESCAEEVFKKLCKYKKNFLRDSGSIDDECWLSNFNKQLKLFWVVLGNSGKIETKTGIMVSFCLKENNDDNGHYIIPSKYFDYSNEDWENEKDNPFN